MATTVSPLPEENDMDMNVDMSVNKGSNNGGTVATIPFSSASSISSDGESQSQSQATMTPETVSPVDINIDADDKPTTIDNWRPVHPDDDDCKALFARRGTWSKAQFEDALDLYHRFTDDSTSTSVSAEIANALECLAQAYRLYGPESIVCSFNGGKDAVVILHLFRAAHAKFYDDCRKRDPDAARPPIRPRAIYFEHCDEFPEVRSFLRDRVRALDLEMLAFAQGVGYVKGLDLLVRNHLLHGSTQPLPVAILLGTRCSDPNAKGQGQFAPSSAFMPPFLRVNPVLEWTYGDVWKFLRQMELPYCCLYDQGYTSLGTIQDTSPCPALATSAGGYRPAFELEDWTLERAGRAGKKKS